MQLNFLRQIELAETNCIGNCKAEELTRPETNLNCYVSNMELLILQQFRLKANNRLYLENTSLNSRKMWSITNIIQTLNLSRYRLKDLITNSVEVTKI